MKLRHVFSVLLTGLLLNCQPDLDVAPLGLPATTTFYKTAKDAESAVTAAYATLLAIYDSENIVTPTTVGSDDGVPFLTGNADRVALWKYNLVSTNTFVNNVWSQAYSGIQRANVVINRIPGVAMDETLKKRYVGEAKFLRALHYFNLVRFFGDLPLVVGETTSLEGVEVPRAKTEEIYAQIEADLKDAEGALPRSYTGNDIGRATLGAAKGLLSKVYLTQAGANASSPLWALAAAKAKEVIELGQYDLWTNYADVFDMKNRGGKESLFEVLYITDQLGNGHSTHWAPRSAPIVPSNGFGTIRVAKSLWDGFAANDKRRDATFLTSYVNPTTGNTVNLSIDTSDPALAVSLWKFADQTAKISGGKSFPYLRFSDILLVYAEALSEAANGPTPDAYTALNRVRNRAGLPPLAGLNRAQFKDAVLQERRLELCWEGNRWFDLVRTGRLVEAVKSENSFGRNATIQASNQLFPIPQRERDINPSLTQNPGY
ncbi:RagB/SusD family nutrient uptake outer membrane protein [Larkinella punicea]|uniref:RagB/SusD family nutrient uptake outer membrane protein n=1 Tax=Larkinella punicea TaxID=2315727 RepID=A0A368JXA7_9BACT|nr:RagB/SusD family nutrient uptake outer membrane protein [Larkinella punicea]RCR71263.1 RagB/SusD family nutrient uptake outer membrane protein [Larkinella punicea]